MNSPLQCCFEQKLSCSTTNIVLGVKGGRIGAMEMEVENLWNRPYSLDKRPCFKYFVKDCLHNIFFERTLKFSKIGFKISISHFNFPSMLKEHII